MVDKLEETVTFLFTDIESSTILWEQNPDTMPSVLAQHDALFVHVIKEWNGTVFQTSGDAFCAVFNNAHDSIGCALAAQLAINESTWNISAPLRVRMALYSAKEKRIENGYYGSSFHHGIELLKLVHGGQILIHNSTEQIVRNSIPHATELKYLGRYKLKEFAYPEKVYQLLHPQLQSNFPQIRSLYSVPHNLPQSLTKFVGRENVLTEIKELLTHNALITLTGSGGCGKTRVAIQTASQFCDKYEDGIWFIDLSSVRDQDGVIDSILAIIRVEGIIGKRDEQLLIRALKDSNTLLILDNCEHLIPACSAIAQTVISNCPNVQILASSRERLGIDCEATYRIPSLTMPSRDTILTSESVINYEAVQLFVDRASSSPDSFVLSEDNYNSIARICRRIDGIPLAIELAAARTRAMSVRDIELRLDSSYRILESASRSSISRHQTLTKLIDWSYELLNSAEKVLLQVVSVFRGGWTPEALVYIAQGIGIGEQKVYDLLTSLVEKSLIVINLDRDQMPYRLLETIRDYAMSKLIDNSLRPQLLLRHRDWYLELAVESSSVSVTDQAELYKRLENENENFNIALDYCLESVEETESGLKIANSLAGFWHIRNHATQGGGYYKSLLSRMESCSTSPLYVDALISAGRLATNQRDFITSEQYHLLALQICRSAGNLQGEADSLTGLGVSANYQNRYEESIEYYEHALILIRAQNNRLKEASLLHNLGCVARRKDDLQASLQFLHQSLAINKQDGNTALLYGNLATLAQIAMDVGDYSLARDYCEQCLSIQTAIQNRSWVSTTLGLLASIEQFEGNAEAALAHLQEALKISSSIGDRAGVALVYILMLETHLERNEYDDAEQYCHLGRQIYSDLKDGNNEGKCLHYAGYIAMCKGNYHLAMEYYNEALTLFKPNGIHTNIMISLEGIGCLHYKLSNHYIALQLLHFTEKIRMQAGLYRSPGDQERFDEIVAFSTNILGDEVLSEIKANCELMELSEVICKRQKLPTY